MKVTSKGENVRWPPKVKVQVEYNNRISAGTTRLYGRAIWETFWHTGLSSYPPPDDSIATANHKVCRFRFRKPATIRPIRLPQAQLVPDMSSKNISFSKAFDELLPLEIKHMIFKWAASDGSSDVKIKLFPNDQDRLDAPAVDFLAKLKDQYSADAYHQALQYLTGPTFWWTFVSDAQPHRFLFRTFRRLVPMEILPSKII